MAGAADMSKKMERTYSNKMEATGEQPLLFFYAGCPCASFISLGIKKKNTMAKIADARFNGKRGSYSFEVYPADTSFNAVGVVYQEVKGDVVKTIKYLGGQRGAKGDDKIFK